jgi:precorrin-2/cobalt-factor-2 C20-methyltransferase
MTTTTAITISDPKAPAARLCPGGDGMSADGFGMFYGVGVGPGDPELMTRKAVRILSSVDWIFLPAGTQGGLGFARRIVEPLGLPAARFRPVSLCMARERGHDRAAYRLAAEDIVGELRRGKSVAWVTEGDPLFYSTFLHLYEELRRYPGVRSEIIPGVTSASAAAARAGVPVARLDEMVAVLPAAYGLGRVPELLAAFPTVILLKVNAVFGELLTVLEALPRPVRTVYVERVGTPGERVVEDLESLRGQEIPYFSLVILRRQGEEGLL